MDHYTKRIAQLKKEIVEQIKNIIPQGMKIMLKESVTLAYSDTHKTKTCFSVEYFWYDKLVVYHPGGEIVITEDTTFTADSLNDLYIAVYKALN